MSVITLIALALAPAIYLSIVIYGRDKYDREPKKVLLIAFLGGAFSVFPAALIETWWESMGTVVRDDILITLFDALIAVALTEELCKFVILRKHAYKHPAFNEPFDGIVYGAFVALGFAAMENLFYVLEGGHGIAVLRMFTAVPAHYSFGVVMGYFVGKAKFNPQRRFLLMFVGVLFATLLHGAYDFFIFQQSYPMLAILTFVVLILSWKLRKKLY